jgi:hypothetical protein
MNTKVTKLFQKRDMQFSKATKQIAAAMAGVIAGVVQFINLNEEMAQGTLTWQDIQLEDDLFLLVGEVNYTAGDKFTTPENESIEVTEHTAEYFKRIVRMALPINLVDNNDPDETLKFLRKVSQEQELDITSKLKSLPSQVDTALFGFDLDSLDDQQLILSQTPSDTKVEH